MVDGSRLAAMAASGDRAAPGAPPGPRRSSSRRARPADRRARRGARPGASALEGVAALLERIPLRPRDVQVVAAPLFHAWGLSHLMLGFTRCATTVVAPRFDAGGHAAQHRRRSAPGSSSPCR